MKIKSDSVSSHQKKILSHSDSDSEQNWIRMRNSNSCDQSKNRFHKRSVFVHEQKNALNADLDLKKFWESLSVRLLKKLFQNFSYQLDVDHSFWSAVIYEMWF